MSRYYFHTDDQRDEEGTELASLEIAKCAAITMTGKIICDQAADFWNRAHWSMTVTDERGLTLFQLQIIGTEAAAISAFRPAAQS